MSLTSSRHENENTEERNVKISNNKILFSEQRSFLRSPVGFLLTTATVALLVGAAATSVGVGVFPYSSSSSSLHGYGYGYGGGGSSGSSSAGSGWRQNLTEDDEITTLNSHIKWIVDEIRNLVEEDHKPLFPLSMKDYHGFFCAALGLMLAAGGGIGGGGMLVPIYILVMGFAPKHAIPLSNITVFGGSLANVYLNASKRHPLADRPLVDWDLILMMEPLTIAGALMGAVINKVLNEMVLVVMLVLLLSYTAYNTLKRAVKMYERESQERGNAMLETFIDDKGEFSSTVELGNGDGNGGEDSTLQKIYDEERTVPMGNITLLVLMFVVVLCINVLKGGGAFPSPLGIKCGSLLYWAANLLNLLWIISISFIARHHLLKKYELKENCGYQ